MTTKKEAEKIALAMLKPKKSIYEITVFTRDHAQYLKWQCNYNAQAIDKIMCTYMSIARYMYEHFNDSKEALKDFRVLSAVVITQLELDCK